MMMKIKLLCIGVIVAITAVFSNLVLAQTTDWEMLVSSRNTHSVKRFDWPSGDYIDDFITSGSGGLNSTQDLTTGPNDNILVSGRGDTAILMYDKATGNFLQQFTRGYGLDNPTKIAFGPRGDFYVSQWGTTQSSVARFDGLTGEFIDEFTPNLSDPLGHTWDSDTNLYVACYSSHDVRKFDPDGNPLGVFTETGHLQGPTNLWFNGEGSLFVVDWDLGSVLQFNDSTGNFTNTFITGLINAEGYAFGPDGNIYLCDWTRNEVRRFTPDGNYIGVFADSGNMQAPNAILFRPVQTTAVDEELGSTPDEFFLSQNYPNPFNPTTQIKFHIPEAVAVKLEIFDLLGEKVGLLVNGTMTAGEYTFQWNATDLPSGIYAYRLTAGDWVKSRKMILMR